MEYGFILVLVALLAFVLLQVVGNKTANAFCQVNQGLGGAQTQSGSGAATTSLPTATLGATSVVSNCYVYEIGGCVTAGCTQTATVESAPINANGTIGSWTATTSLPTATVYATSVVSNGYVYEIGGCATLCPTATVESAPINSSGTIGSWTATTPLPTATGWATSVVSNGYLYEIGGLNGSAVATVESAPINSSGTIGSWTATTSLPTATYAATSVVSNGYLYEIGGTIGSAVESAPINANGTIGSWTATTSLPAANNLATSVVSNGYLYEIGGWTGSSAVATVEYAPINANGAIGSW